MILSSYDIYLYFSEYLLQCINIIIDSDKLISVKNCIARYCCIKCSNPHVNIITNFTSINTTNFAFSLVYKFKMQAVSDFELSKYCQSVSEEKCNETLLNETDLVTHVEIHTGEELNQCNQCNKSFSHKSELDIHVKAHIKERKYQCNQCPKSFIKKYDLERHHITYRRKTLCM